MFEFDWIILEFDGVFRSSLCGWYIFGYVNFVFLFFFGYLWYGGCILFRDVFVGIGVEVLE